MKKVFCLTAALLLLAAMPWELAASNSRSRSDRQSAGELGKCKVSLKNLYACLKLYAADHEGALPGKDNAEGLKRLFKSGATLRDMECQGYDGRTVKKIEDFREANSPYIYFGGANYPAALKSYPKLPLICDKPGSRHLYVLTVDGQIDEIDLKKSKRKISNCQELVALLNSVYKYPPALLKLLQSKAQATDKNVSGKKR